MKLFTISENLTNNTILTDITQTGIPTSNGNIEALLPCQGKTACPLYAGGRALAMPTNPWRRHMLAAVNVVTQVIAVVID